LRKSHSRKRKAEKAAVVCSEDANKNEIKMKMMKVWVSLLFERPPATDKPGLAKWLKKVLSASDENKPLADETKG